MPWIFFAVASPLSFSVRLLITRNCFCMYVHCRPSMELVWDDVEDLWLDQHMQQNHFRWSGGDNRHWNTLDDPSCRTQFPRKLGLLNYLTVYKGVSHSHTAIHLVCIIMSLPTPLYTTLFELRVQMTQQCFSNCHYILGKVCTRDFVVLRRIIEVEDWIPRGKCRLSSCWQTSKSSSLSEIQNALDELSCYILKHD